MKQSRFVELSAFMASVWGRELTAAQKAAGWKLLADVPDEAVENAVVAIAEEGGAFLPPWSLVLKTARTLAEAMRQALPALPAGDSLSDAEHQSALFLLSAKNTPEQSRRNVRCAAIKQLPRERWLAVRLEVGSGEIGHMPAVEWDIAFDAVMERERGQLAQRPLVLDS